MSVMLFLPSQSRLCHTEQCHITALLGVRETPLSSVSGMPPCFSSCVSFGFFGCTLQLVADVLGQIHQLCHSKHNIQLQDSCLPCHHPADFSVNALRKLSSSINLLVYI